MLLTNVKDLREDNDITQVEMALILGVSKSTYGRWETDEKIIPAGHFNDLCNYFNISMDYAVGLTKCKDTEIVNSKLNKELIGKRLKIFRKSKKLTQVKLASAVNTTHSTISEYETGKHMLQVSFAYDIARKYEISLDYLYGRSEEPFIKH